MADPRIGEIQFVEYHSDKWALLVETGWITMTVRDGRAQMIFQPEPKW